MKKRDISERAVEFILTREVKELATLTEERVSGILGVDRLYLAREFQEDQDISLPQFIAREKIYRAVFMMEAGSEASARELSRKLGFPGVKEFVREFKKHFFIEPDRYLYLKRYKKWKLDKTGVQKPAPVLDIGNGRF